MLDIILYQGADRSSETLCLQKLCAIAPPGSSLRRVYSEEVNAWAKAYNAGAQGRAGEYLLFLDSRVIMPEGCLEAMLEALEARGRARHFQK